jgi:hypothetical protein
MYIKKKPKQHGGLAKRIKDKEEHQTWCYHGGNYKLNVSTKKYTVIMRESLLILNHVGCMCEWNVFLIVHMVSWTLFFNILGGILGFALRVSCVLGRFFTTRSTPPSLFYLYVQWVNLNCVFPFDLAGMEPLSSSSLSPE